MSYKFSEPDKELFSLLKQEEKRQEKSINLIASENIAPDGVLRLLGSAFVNKYSEGYPHKRYYPATKLYDEIEEMAQQRTRDAFGLDEQWHINVQPYSGAIANMAIYHALLNPGDTILSMRLDAGGHLSHGAKASVVSDLFSVVQYGVDEQYRINYDEIEEYAKKHKPRCIVSGASAYPFVIDFERIGKIAHDVGAYHLADISHYAGLVASGVYPSPFGHADVVMTTTHKSLLGPRAALICVDTQSGIAQQNEVDIAKLIDKAVFPGIQGGPHNNAIAAMAHGLLMVKSDEFKTYTHQVVANAKALADALTKEGAQVVGDGTESHVVLVDVSTHGIDGKEAEELLEKNNILANRNTLAGDTSPRRPSGIRMGTYDVTMRGMIEKDMKNLAQTIITILSS